MDQCKVKECGLPMDNGITYDTKNIIDLKTLGAFVGGSAIFTRNGTVLRRDGGAVPSLTLF